MGATLHLHIRLTPAVVGEPAVVGHHLDVLALLQPGPVTTNGQILQAHQGALFLPRARAVLLGAVFDVLGSRVSLSVATPGGMSGRHERSHAWDSGRDDGPGKFDLGIDDEILKLQGRIGGAHTR